jgi:hypothetical protein
MLEDAARGVQRCAFEIDDRGSQNPAYTLSVLVGSRRKLALDSDLAKTEER